MSHLRHFAGCPCQYDVSHIQRPHFQHSKILDPRSLLLLLLIVQFSFIRLCLTMIAIRKPALLSPLLRQYTATKGLGSIRTLVAPYVPDARKKPTLEEATAMPLSVEEMDNSTLVSLGAMECHDARMEILKRHIMSKDRIPYEEAEEIFKKISVKNKEGMWVLALPYQVGVTVALTTGALSLPMVFDLNTAHWFNELYVTMDVSIL
jgi:hypothetical protein